MVFYESRSATRIARNVPFQDVLGCRAAIGGLRRLHWTPENSMKSCLFATIHSSSFIDSLFTILEISGICVVEEATLE